MHDGISPPGYYNVTTTSTSSVGEEEEVIVQVASLRYLRAHHFLFPLFLLPNKCRPLVYKSKLLIAYSYKISNISNVQKVKEIYSFGNKKKRKDPAYATNITKLLSHKK